MSHSKKKSGKARPATGSKSASAGGNVLFTIENEKFQWGLLALVILAVTMVRSRFAGMPLERDEGEYAYFGQLILDGVAPYKEAYNMKLPGIYYMYAFIMMIFGESYKGIHYGALLMNTGSMILFYAGLKRVFSPMAAIAGAGFFGLMGMSMHVLGFAAHATHFAVFFMLLGFYFFFRYQKDKKILFAFLFGLGLGLSFLMKQQAVYFIIMGGLLFVILGWMEQGRQIPKLAMHTAIFSVGVFVPYIIVVLLMLVSGTFENFWFWTVQYASKYASGVPYEQGKEMFKMTFDPIYSENSWIWWMAVAGLLLMLLTKTKVEQKIFAIVFFLFGFLATTPGLYFRQHYFIVWLPSVALMAGYTLHFAGHYLSEKFKMNWAAWVLPLVVFLFLFNRTTGAMPFYYSPQDPVALCKMVYGTNPFIESVEIANYIKANSTDEDEIAVLGSEPQIAFYSGRRSATGHIYTYGLMEIHDYNIKMQEEMIAEIEEAKPLYLVFCNVPFSWLSKPDSPMKIFEWYNKYATENYNIVGLVDIPDRGFSKIYWNEQAQRNPDNKNSVWVFKRKEPVAP